MSTVINMPPGTQVPTQTSVPRRSYRRRYRRSYGRRRATRSQRIYSSLRRKFPYSQYGLQFVKRDDSTKQLYGETSRLATAQQLINRRNNLYYGKGGYASDMIELAKRYNLGRRVLGAGLGYLSGGGAGAVSGFFGQGEYGGVNDIIKTKSDMDLVPSFAQESDDGIIISKREYVCDIFGPEQISGSNPPKAKPFVNYTFNINPGLETSFPWLSQIAANYEEYEMLQCIYTFRSTTTETNNSSDGQVGTVAMCVTYNANLPPLRDKQSIVGYAHSISGKLTETMLQGVECDPAKLSGTRGEYIRTGPAPVGTDLKSMDHGVLQIAVCNCNDDYLYESLGELWCSYTVRLRKPKMQTAEGRTISQDLFVSGAGTETGSQLMGGIQALLRGFNNNIGSVLDFTANNINITFPPRYAGTVRIVLYVGVASGSTSGGVTGYSKTGNIEEVRDMYGDNGNTTDVPAFHNGFWSQNSGTFESHWRISVATDGTANRITLTTAGGNASPSQSSIFISEYNTSWSYYNNNLGSSDAPVLVNSDGVIVAP